MELSIKNFDLVNIKKDLLNGIKECSERGLCHSVKWLSELNYSLSAIKIPEKEGPLADNYDCKKDFDNYLLAKSYFDVKEYDRCAFYTENSDSPKCRFLYFYSRYFAIEKRKLDTMTDINSPPDMKHTTQLRDLSFELKEKHLKKQLDGYCLYLYGVTLKKLDLNSAAIDVFVEAVYADPINWAAWQELAYLVPNKEKVNSLQLPDHWIKIFFLAHAYLEQLNNEDALQIYFDLHSQGFDKSTYIMAEMAIAYHNRRELYKSVDTFKELLSIDPYRLDNLDTYSNLLYVREMKTELADLAHKAIEIDKYRVETCCVIGNYYSLRSEHQKAVTYFERALKLNPHYLSAWTLMGHEYMEMKNTNAAILSYRKAIEVNKRDYRAWYGLGQTYEILKMPSFCLYYYKQAQQLRPNDSRMIIALGETYEKLERNENALKCYYKAYNVGDIEGSSLLKLAKLYEKLNDHENAAAAYIEYCLKESEQQQQGAYEEKSDYYLALQYLANYHLGKGNLEDAADCAYKCLEHDETKEAGKALLKTIAAKRGHPENEVNVQPVDMEETGNSSHMTVDDNLQDMDVISSPY